MNRKGNLLIKGNLQQIHIKISNMRNFSNMLGIDRVTISSLIKDSRWPSVRRVLRSLKELIWRRWKPVNLCTKLQKLKSFIISKSKQKDKRQRSTRIRKINIGRSQSYISYQILIMIHNKISLMSTSLFQKIMQALAVLFYSYLRLKKLSLLRIKMLKRK